MGRPRKDFDVTDVANGKDLSTGELGNPGPIEKVSETDFVAAAELEKFMHEPVRILIHESADEDAVEVVVPQVNSMNQPIIRGQEIIVKRKYVEVLARCRITKYKQQMGTDNRHVEGINIGDRTALTYPFTVIEDRNPDGRPWLKAILAQP